jgi:hypothetical protein
VTVRAEERRTSVRRFGLAVELVAVRRFGLQAKLGGDAVRRGTALAT